MKKDRRFLLIYSLTLMAVFCCSGCILSENEKPVASFTMEPSSVAIDEIIYFNSTSYDKDGSIMNYSWMINGNLIGCSSNISFTFQENGSYQIQLSVKDNKGDSDTSEKIVLLGDIQQYYEKLIGEWEWNGNNQTGQWIFYENNTLKSTFSGIGGASTTDWWKWDMWLNTSQLLFSEPSDTFWQPAVYDFEFQDDFSTLKITYNGSIAYWYKVT